MSSPLLSRAVSSHSTLRADSSAEGQTGAQPQPVGHTHLLYRHALECIFAFADLNELHALLSVCRGWHQAVLSMRPILATVGTFDQPAGLLVPMCQSSLRVHVGELTIGDLRIPASSDQLILVASRLTSLRQLEVTLQPIVPPVFPHTLTELHLTILQPTDVDVMAPIGQLSQLQELRMNLHHDLPASFAPLTRLPLLTYLYVQVEAPVSRLLSDTQVQQLRDIPLREFASISPYMEEAGNMCRLLAPPHTLQWQEVGRVMNDAVGALLPLLPSLTHVDVWEDCTHLDWAGDLPVLTSLWVWIRTIRPVDSSRVFAGLQRCTALTDLTLWGSPAFTFTSEQLATTLPRMPLLRRLSVESASRLTSLAFLAQQPTSSTLTSLEISGGGKHIPVSELQHLNTLSALEKLSLSKGVFSQPLSADVQQQYTPPSLLLPSLQQYSLLR